MADHKRPESMERITTPALAEQFIAEQVAAVRAQVGDKKVLLALSGGVDSSVVAALLIKAVGKQLTCVHVNHGLLRKGEPEQVVEVFRNQMDANLVYVDAVDRFLDKLAGVADPETKRKIIGAEFIRVFEEEARKLEGIEFLAQGTIYPDILESGQSRPTITWAACRRTFSLRWWNRSSSSSKMKSAWWEKRWVCRTAWCSVSPSPVPVWAYAAWVPLPVTGWRRCGNPTRFFGRSLPSMDWRARFGSILLWCRISSPPVCGTMPEPLTGR